MAPPRDLRLRRFSANRPSLRARLARKVKEKLTPLLVPLCAGLAVAGAVDLVLPERLGNEPAAVATVAAAPDFAFSDTRAATDDIADDAADDVADVADVAAAAGTASLTPMDATLGGGEGAEGSSAPSTAVNVGAALAAAPALARGTAPETPKSTRQQALEDRIETMLERGKTPYAAVVVMEAHTGRVLAIAEHSTRGSSKDLALQPMAPAASVFKIVTASALLEDGLSPSSKICYHGGKTRMRPALLENSKRDNRCLTFGDVVPHSANVAIAKLAKQHLSPLALRGQAARWGFGSDLGFEGLTPSTATIPVEPFAFAESAAGFGDVKISAMHGAVLASIVANGGLLVPPTDVVGGEHKGKRVVSPKTARALKSMLADTVTAGTGRRTFQQRPRLDVSAAGKTGSLTDYSTGLDTSWFVGYAPADSPELVVAAVVVNTAIWHIKAPWLAKESLRAAFKERGSARATGKVAAR